MDGWTIDVDSGSVLGQRHGKCRDDNSWYGYNYYNKGSIKTTLHGCGKAEIDFGDCWGRLSNWRDPYTQVNLNGNEIGRAYGGDLSKKIQFDFKEGDILELLERDRAMIRFNNFTILSCC